MGFDLAAGVNQNQMNQVASAVYNAVYPAYFKGSVDVPSISVRVDYDVDKSPVFDLKPLTDAQRQQLVEAITQNGAIDQNTQRLIAAVVDATAAFVMTVPEIKVTVTSTRDGSHTDLTLSAQAVCQAEVNPSDGQVSFKVLSLTLPSQSDPTIQFLLDHVVRPLLQDQIDKYLQGVRLPALNVEGVALSIPAVTVENGRLVVLTTLKSRGTPSPDSFPWPGDNFFALLSPDLMTTAAWAAVQKLHPEFHDSGSASANFYIGKVSVGWHYEAALHSPQVALNDNNQVIGLGMTAGAGAKVCLTVPVIGTKCCDLGVRVTSDPNPSADLRLSVDAGKNVIVTTQQIHPFNLKIRLEGVPSWLSPAVDWITDIITAGITESLRQVVNQFIQGMKFSVYQLPTINIDEGPIHVKVDASDIQVNNQNNNLAIRGNLNVTKQPPSMLELGMREVAATKE